VESGLNWLRQVVSWFPALPNGAGRGAEADDWAGAGLPVCRIKNKFALGAEVCCPGVG
jgi:hypothetical protein